jgi:hypothetical protein
MDASSRSWRGNASLRLIAKQESGWIPFQIISNPIELCGELLEVEHKAVYGGQSGLGEVLDPGAIVGDG